MDFGEKKCHSAFGDFPQCLQKFLQALQNFLQALRNFIHSHLIFLNTKSAQTDARIYRRTPSLNPWRREWKIYVLLLLSLGALSLSLKASLKIKIPRLCLKTGDYDVWL